MPYIYLLTEARLGQPYDAATQRDAIKQAIAAQGITAGTVYVVPRAQVRKLVIASDPAPPTIVSDDPLT